ncbi:N-acetylmuramic acid 6-phosphate etherase [Bosea vaviloviae]|uniref:N-acetylmuramic acid 6-phosphate etherase n=1 Tax=Bosea vaviloviae TaxID=1526658 RepID=A0A1D7TVM0_9HYPH|nr:N-acetylmuramic acid 6-phosphate etherase [Bosea vaviloviae]AOO79172.1 N-acetylmuramic acid 6-phosphate etherase [Bosea vaviloviae]
MATEDVDPRFTDLDAWPFASAMEAMWDGQMAAVAAVRSALPALTAAAAAAAEVLGESGRLVYVGAGTSGRVAVQDGAELPPTFDWPLERIVFAMAGGQDALISSVEGAEDDTADGIRRMEEARIGPADVVIGVAASGTTPFTVAAVQRATERGAVTIGIANNAGAPLLAAARFPVLVETGSELIAGSTRMKAGTAQKVVLNLISTGIMLRLGRVYRGMMVNMRTANAKLKLRAQQMVARIAGCDVEEAAAALQITHGDIKLATLVVLGYAPEAAAGILARSGGNLRVALSDIADGTL